MFLSHNKKRFLIITAAASIAAYSFYLQERSYFPEHVVMNGKTYSLEIADTEPKRELGLGGRDVLCPTCGMLFVFPKEGKFSFWMKGMRFSLDIIWLYDEKVVSIEQNIPADSSRIFIPKEAANRVLELNAGESAGLKEGEKVRLYR